MSALARPTKGSHAPRRSCLFVSALGDMAAAAASEADSFLFDLEDACPPDKKAEGRERIASALASGMFDGKTCTVRINAVTTPWCYRDIIDVVGGAHGHLDSLTIPKFTNESEVMFVDHLLTQLELDLGLTETIGLELLVETAAAVTRLREVASASERTVALVFGPHDYTISLGYEDFGWGTTIVRDSNFQLGWAMHEIATHAHARGLLAIDGVAHPFTEESYRASGREALLIGYDGKWCMNEDEVTWANETWTPELSVYQKAESLLATPAPAPQPGVTVVPPNDALLDQAARLAARGRRAGLRAESQTGKP